MNTGASKFVSFLCKSIVVCITSLTMSNIARSETPGISDPDALHQRVSEFTKAISDGDLHTFFTMFPPRIFSEEAKKHGTTPEVGIDLATKEIGEKMAKQGKIISYTIDDSRPRIVALENGTSGILLPIDEVELLIEKNKKVQIKSEALAIREGEIWYILPLAARWEFDVMREYYPEYKGIKIEASSTELKD
jgi:hypothetical protein